ncbi:TetR/AcrR family transcriptional regulator [uncultured Brevibacillus sp.]|uniref:TetR/AcrR family transcriptional regulator n=1 Tax=uncultured Brevibacillus sp. TaxID=169970 RepID=UPI0025979826|nr:TetR/AcrR family transcriptional regulator [uncultured Brevibacillus sp.]
MQYMREDWVRTALTKLTEAGIESVRVEALAREMNISKGSFYHHFQDRQDLLDSMISYWEEHTTERIIHPPDSTSQTLEQLLGELFSREQKLEAAMYAWAKQNAALRHRLIDIEKRRIEYVTALYQKNGVPKAEAKARAELAYLMYVGWLLRTEINAEMDIQAALAHFLAWK